MAESLARAIQILDGLIQKAAKLSNADFEGLTTKEEEVKAQDAKTHEKGAQSLEAQPSSKDAADASKFKKAKLAVGLVVEVKEMSNSDKLYRCQVQVAPDQFRQIIAGLRKHISKEELQGKLVVAVLNLSAKIAGEASDGMILAAVEKGDHHRHGELVKPLCPPGKAWIPCLGLIPFGRTVQAPLTEFWCIRDVVPTLADHANPGELIYLEGGQAEEVYPKECRQWRKLLPHLAVRNATATYGGHALCCCSGTIRVDQAIPDGAAIS